MGSVVQTDVNVTLPNGLEPLCIRNGTLDLELLRPLDYVEPPSSPVQRPGTPIPLEPEVLPTITHVVEMPPIEERRRRAAAAAEARMAQAKN